MWYAIGIILVNSYFSCYQLFNINKPCIALFSFCLMILGGGREDRNMIDYLINTVVVLPILIKYIIGLFDEY